jgi:hypothetical protein
VSGRRLQPPNSGFPVRSVKKSHGQSSQIARQLSMTRPLPTR